MEIEDSVTDGGKGDVTREGETDGTLPLEQILPPLLAEEGEFHFPLAGTSMQPTIPAGSLLAIRPLTSPPLPGEVVVFVREGKLIAHRLMRRVRLGRRVAWVAQGDNCPLPDPLLSPQQIIGRVYAASHAGQRVWPGRRQRVERWRWLGRHYFGAAIRRLRRFLHRSIQWGI